MQCFVLTLFINLVIIVLLFFFSSFSQEKAKSKETILSALWCVCLCESFLMYFFFVLFSAFFPSKLFFVFMLFLFCFLAFFFF